MRWEDYLAIFFLILLLVYRWSTANYNFFKDRGIDHHKPYPFLGSMWKMILLQKSMFDLTIELYNQSNSKVYGIFEQRTPILMIRDPELIKKITIKDFDHFMNHWNIFGADNDDPHDMDNMFGSSLFSMRDTRWKDMRSTLSPAFTCSKMRQMFQLMDLVANDSLQCLKSDQYSKDGFEVDIKDYFTRFTNDVIASTVFGLQVNSFKVRKNIFFMLGKKLTELTILQNIKFFLFTRSKKVFGLTLFDKKSTDYFVRLVMNAMKYRQENNIVKQDMINMLMEASGMIQTDKTKSGIIRNWNTSEIVAQCFIFFFAGFENSAVLMCFTAHELMENEDVQKKLYEEVDQVNSDLEGGQLTYDALMGMKYMDQVVSEVLRKWPAAVAIDRECNKDITYVVDGKNVEIKKGEVIWFPVSGFHRDPKYFKNPEKFDPERFSDENKDNIQPFTYFPFGAGPRSCIASRFALIEAKAVIYYLLRDFRIVASKKSTIPMVLNPNGFQMKPKNGFWLKLIPRNKNF
ncbi:probable cytochrome P450 9f2 [Drosophila innubila]|uniref:probable cytochrome P450 9f2 n=1 Tax=Drosophila innubila TaxID=198719 RepID=UPI00148C2CBA|nr:probable cytochrome P450 9f2 [Drosophila innubila]